MIASLFHITHLDNVDGILRKGLLCRNRIETLHLPYLDLSDASCQSRRSNRDLGGHSVDLHNYVPLFIEPRNAMLYRLEKSLAETGAADDRVILAVSGSAAQCRGGATLEQLTACESERCHGDLFLNVAVRTKRQLTLARGPTSSDF